MNLDPRLKAFEERKTKNGMLGDNSCLRGGLIAPEQQTHRAVFDRGIMHSHIRGCKLWSIDSQYTKEAYLRHVA